MQHRSIMKQKNVIRNRTPMTQDSMTSSVVQRVGTYEVSTVSIPESESKTFCPEFGLNDGWVT